MIVLLKKIHLTKISILFFWCFSKTNNVVTLDTWYFLIIINKQMSGKISWTFIATFLILKINKYDKYYTHLKLKCLKNSGKFRKIQENSQIIFQLQIQNKILFHNYYFNRKFFITFSILKSLQESTAIYSHKIFE